MKVCITEKPSVARDIAKILGADTQHDGYLEGSGYQVTWTFGHLCCLKDPADYTDMWKRWALGQLPMIPARFGIKLIADRGIENQFRTIERLVSQAEEIINCGDAGQEGELIQRWVMQKAGATCPVKRLWISSLTESAIREGFASLRPSSDFDTLYHAGLSRAIGDWILGINATRLYTLKYRPAAQRAVLSVGRVQTPTLALVVQRHREIQAFTSKDFYEVRTIYRDTPFNAQRLGKITDRAKAEAIVARIAPEPLVITDIEQKQGRESAPRLFDLTSLQVECNKRWGWTADQTLQRIQSLYEKKVTTYPRVDTTYLSEDIHAKVPEILGRMTPYAGLAAPVLAGPIPKSKKVFDNSKVTDHHAIIPTGESPSRLVGEEKHLYHLIALRFIAAFYPDCIYMQTTVSAKAGDVDFRAIGKVITSEGWRAVLIPSKDTADAKDKADDESSILPEFTKGESGPHKPEVVKKTTTPPKPYTEGTLLRAMESAGKTVDDEALREAMKENGIGRPSTRSAIIETLFKRNYIARKGKSIVATEAGINLIDTIRNELLKSAKLTGIWENKLRRIERGEYSAAEFIDELKQQISEIVIEVLSDNSSRRILVNTEEPPKAKAEPKRPRTTKYEQIPCPECGTGHIIKGRTAFGCSRYAEGCGLRLTFDRYPETLTPGQLRKLVEKKK